MKQFDYKTMAKMEKSKADKYNSKITILEEQLMKHQFGGGKKDKKDNVSKSARKNDDGRFAMNVRCVSVVQERKKTLQNPKLEYKGRICKTPKIRINISDEKPKLAKLIKIIIIRIKF